VSDFLGEVGGVLAATAKALPWIGAYVLLILLLMLVWRGVLRLFGRARGDEMRARWPSATRARCGRARGSVLSFSRSSPVGGFTGSALVPRSCARRRLRGGAFTTRRARTGRATTPG
jgi:hypothetical protein